VTRRDAVDIRVQPLTNWPYPSTEKRTAPPFRAKYGSTEAILKFELAELGAKEVAMHVVTENGRDDVRQDGLLRARARLIHPGVALEFQSKHGPMAIWCDSYESKGTMTDWQSNLRAIALTLEKLRAINRYGIGQGGQQYAGWLQIEMTSAEVDRDWARLTELARVQPGQVTSDELFFRAKKFTHPDRHEGDRALWDEVQALGQRLSLKRS
jgi:hypothetical protein